MSRTLAEKEARKVATALQEGPYRETQVECIYYPDLEAIMLDLAKRVATGTRREIREKIKLQFGHRSQGFHKGIEAALACCRAGRK